MSIVRVVIGLLGAAGLSLGLSQGADELPGTIWDLREPNSPAQTTAAQLTNFSEHECAECHLEIAAEWAATRHGMAWVNEVYQAELLTIVKQEKCHSCHAPQPLLLTGVSKRPKTRADNVHFGVDCESCHLGPEGAIHGPRGTQVAAHESVRDRTFIGQGSNELCLGCHSRSVGPVIGLGRDFDDAELEDAGYSCVACHMAEVERPMATQAAGGAPTRPRKGRSHLLQTPRDPSFMRQAFAFSISERDGERGLKLANRAGHRIPGLNDRVIDFTVQLLGSEGAKPTVHEVQISREEPLGVREEIWIPLGTPAPTGIHVRGLQRATSLAGPVEFMDEDIALPAGS